MDANPGRSQGAFFFQLRREGMSSFNEVRISVFMSRKSDLAVCCATGTLVGACLTVFVSYQPLGS